MKKAITLVSIILITAASFLAPQNAVAQVTDAEKQLAKTELNRINAEFIRSVNDQNIPGVLKEYSPNVMSINPDGSVNNYQQIAGGLEKGFKSVKSIKYTMVKEEYRVLSATLVLCTWTGTVETELKTGKRMKNFPHIASLLYTKVNGKWLIEYEHVSEAPPKPEGQN